MIPAIQATKWIGASVTLLWILHIFSSTAAAQFAGGSGTAENPYQIKTLEQLQTIADSIHLDKHFIQIADIDAGETADWNEGKGFDPIGWRLDTDNNNPFIGSFNGNSYSITDLYINRPDESTVGLFGYVENAGLNNVALLNISVIGENSAGGLVGLSYRSEINGSYVTGVVLGEQYVGGLAGSNGGFTRGNINDSHAIVNVSGNQDVGGLVGISGGEIVNSYSAGDVTGSERVGGLVGWDEQGIISGSYASGEISGNIEVGGLVGLLWSSNVIDSYATGDVTGSKRVGGLIGIQLSEGGKISGSYASGNVSGNSEVGGLVGHFYDGTMISDSYASGIVTGKNLVGGLIGISQGPITDSYAIGEVMGDSIVGGFVGRNNGSILNSFATGAVKGGSWTGGLAGDNGGPINYSYATGDVSGVKQAGGLVGRNGNEIIQSFAKGQVSGEEGIGGLIGYNAGSGQISNSYAHGDVDGVSDAGGLVGVNKDAAVAEYSFSSGMVTGNENIGGLIGVNEATVGASYWDTETSNQSNSTGSGVAEDTYGLTTDQMTGQNAGDHMSELDFEEIWQLTEGYPLLAWQDPEDVLALLTVDPMEHDFGEVDPDSTQSHEFTFRNTGNATLNGNATLSGTENSAFEVSRGEEAWSLKPYRSLTVEVVFHPAGEVSFQAVLEVSHDAPDQDSPIEVILSGTGKTLVSAQPEESLLRRFELLQNYPNPFNPTTIIPFELPESSQVLLEIFDLLGRRVAVLTDQPYEAGRHEISWNAKSAASGIYVVRLMITTTQEQHRQFHRLVTLVK